MADLTTWQVKHPDGRGVFSPIPYCGYDRQTLNSLQRNGYRLFCDGKRVKFGGKEK